MEGAVDGSTGRVDVALNRRTQGPESDYEEGKEAIGQERINAFVNLQQTRARAIELSKMSFDKVSAYCIYRDSTVDLTS